MRSSRYPVNPILIVDDEASVVQATSALLTSHGLNNLLGCQDSREVMAMLRDNEVEIVLLDLNMPHITGRKLLDQIRAEYPHIPVIVVTAANEVQTAVECMRAGVFDYMVKAIEESRLVSGVRRAIESREQARNLAELRSRFMTGELNHPEAFSSIITRSSKMKSIFIYIEAIAHTTDPVLITGETGVGKQLIARAVHDVSRRTGEFVEETAGRFDSEKLADTLFGHEKGSFTHAVDSRAGLIHEAKGGTLFLDEIGDLSKDAQIQLLKFFDTGKYSPFGADRPRRSDVRIVLATNRNLKELMEKHLFRRDLYFRISIHEITVPPLRERTEDLPLLLEHFTNSAAKEYNKNHLDVPVGLAGQISSYSFPGNIRELQKWVKNAVLAAKPSDTVLPVRPILEAMRQGDPTTGDEQPEAGLLFGDILPTVEQATQLLRYEALARSGGNISEAARLIGISHQALSKWLKDHGG